MVWASTNLSAEKEYYEEFKRAEEKARLAYDEAEQDLRLFIINRAFRAYTKPYPVCGATDLPNENGTYALECQLPKGHKSRWHQEWSEDGRLLGEWS